MIRKITLLLLLCIGSYGFVQAQTEDSVSIYLPYGSDTTCPGDQLKFTAVESNDTAIGSTFAWFINGIFTGVTLDTFYTTAANDGDTVHCMLYFINSLSLPDTARSNVITVHRSSAIMPRVLSSIIAGSNPDCPGHPITFSAYPIVGGTAPQYQWYIDNAIVSGATGSIYTSIFADGDTVSCMMISNATCAFPTDTAYSNGIEIIHDSLTAMISIAVYSNPICATDSNAFTATVADAGLGSTIYWYVNGVLVPGAIGPLYITDTLHNGDIVHAKLIAPDDCVINDTTISTAITMIVIPNLNPTASITLTSGANPGCIDSAITFTATYGAAGTAPDLIWLVNDVEVASGTATHTQAYASGDLLTFRVRTTDMGCYLNDSVTTPAVLMVRDSTPVAPLVSLIDNMLVANTAGTYIWYFNGTIIPGANAQTYHPGMMGFYAAIRDTGNCQSLLSNIIYISLLDVKNIAAGSVKIYPNPTSGILSIDRGTNTSQTKMTVFSVVGQVMMEAELEGKARFDADLSQFPSGSYIVSFRTAEGAVSNHKILLSK
ncbi:MAG: T9SS type A sorting domain-containing protein [Taibaiella sp.]|nr:T9SS type A sorting domain-containing protein [Taibaiella sp.]